MALENGIAQRVEEFIAAGRPSVRRQHIDDRRAGYIASTALAGKTEMRVEVSDVELEGMTLRVVSPRHASGALPCPRRGLNSDPTIPSSSFSASMILLAPSTVSGSVRSSALMTLSTVVVARLQSLAM